MSASYRQEPREPREMRRGNVPAVPTKYRLSDTAEPMPCAGCGGSARTLLIFPTSYFWSCGGSKCVLPPRES